jgi:putative MATE family efflux protein
MKDFTQGHLRDHLLATAAPISVGIIVQTLYFLLDVFFLASFSNDAVAGVGAAAPVTFLVFALTQVAGVGSVALISQAAGRKDPAHANLLFNQSIVLAVLYGSITLAVGYSFAGIFMQWVAADPEAAAAGTAYLRWVMPGLALQFALVLFGSALRAIGILKPTLMAQLLTIVVNAVLAPILTLGWLTGHPLGAAGAGLATSIAGAIGVLLMYFNFARFGRYFSVKVENIRPRLKECRNLLRIGLPAGGEYALIFLYSTLVYWAITGFGAAAQAGFAIGYRLSQALTLPAIAICFAVGPIVGQNVGANHFDRVIRTFRECIVLIAPIMIVLTLYIQWRPASLIGLFTDDAAVLVQGALFLQISSWNFLAQALIFTCSGVFQGMGHTRPALASSASRLLTFGVPLVWLTGQPEFRIEHVWYLSVATTCLQAVVAALWLRMELNKRYSPLSTQPKVATGESASV